MGCIPSATKKKNGEVEVWDYLGSDGSKWLNGTPGETSFLNVCGSDPQERRTSKSISRLEDLSRQRTLSLAGPDPHLQEIFEFSDFSVNLAPVNSPRARRTNSKQLMGYKRQQSGDTFKFGDFQVSMETDMDDRIVSEHLHHHPVARGTVRPQTAMASRSRQQELGRGVIHNYHIYTLLGHATRVKCIALAPNEQYYLSCSHEDMALSMHDIHTGRETVAFLGHEDTIISTSISADSKLLATTSRDNTMILWDAVTGKQLFIFDHEKVVICCAFSHDSRHLVSGCQDMVCRVWDVRKRREILAFTEHDGIIVAVCWSPNNETIASAAADKTVRVWSARNTKCQHVLLGHQGIVLACSFSPDGTKLASNDEHSLKVWAVATGACLHTTEVGAITRPVLAPSVCKRLAWTLSAHCPGGFGAGHLVVVSNDRLVYVLAADTGAVVLSFYCKAPVYCLAVGLASTIALGDSFGNVYIVVLR